MRLSFQDRQLAEARHYDALDNIFEFMVVRFDPDALPA
jgi:hypothetical protein